MLEILCQLWHPTHYQESNLSHATPDIVGLQIIHMLMCPAPLHSPPPSPHLEYVNSTLPGGSTKHRHFLIAGTFVAAMIIKYFIPDNSPYG